MTHDTIVSAFDRASARVLAAGVWTSAGLLLLGLALLAVGAQAWATPVIDSGLVVLMATPAGRILVLLGEYCYARDWVSVATTLGVIGVLVFTLVSALRI